MNILELSVTADAEGAEALAAVFNEYAYGGAVVEQTVTPEPGETLDPARPFTVRAFVLLDDSAAEKRRALEHAVWHLGRLHPFGELAVRELAEADWANAWKKFYTVLHVGARTVIRPSWLEYEPRPDEIVVTLDPGMAFGTGLHPTTRLCLAALEKYLAPEMCVLDLGTGSGILAIAAARLGASQVDAWDIDEIAVETARRNVELNHVERRVRVRERTLTTAEEPGQFDIIVSNLLAEAFLDLAPALSHHLRPGGTCIASGILAEKAPMVQDAFQASGLHLLESAREEDWLALVSRRD